ncbi:MAG TPA: hypothetical protein VFN13_09720 [Rudaea sp.]|nr:hypothetical protein [Rudaea sp.]
MRQVYTSARVENVERVVAMFTEAGIETRVTNLRPWASRDYKRPSYSDRGDRSDWPQVWIVKAEDQPRARAMLREAGIEPATRFAEELAKTRAPATKKSPASLRAYLRLGLIGAILILALLRWYGFF